MDTKRIDNIGKILGVRIDNLGRNEILRRAESFLLEPRFHQIATINPEFILEAQKNPEFKKILNSCDLNIADGAGIWFAFLRWEKYLKSRIAGADLMMEILRLADRRKLGIFLACRKDGLSFWEETRDAILKIYPNLEIEGANLECHSYRSDNSVSSFSISALDSRLRGNDNAGKCGILFCNFGAPYQELFINSIKCDNIRLAMGVGGGFDFLTRKVKRSPKFLRRAGLEWMWRIFQQKEFRLKRIKRALKSIIIFPIKVVFRK